MILLHFVDLDGVNQHFRQSNHLLGNRLIVFLKSLDRIRDLLLVFNESLRDQNLNPLAHNFTEPIYWHDVPYKIKEFFRLDLVSLSLQECGGRILNEPELLLPDILKLVFVIRLVAAAESFDAFYEVLVAQLFLIVKEELDASFKHCLDGSLSDMLDLQHV